MICKLKSGEIMWAFWLNPIKNFVAPPPLFVSKMYKIMFPIWIIKSI